MPTAAETRANPWTYALALVAVGLVFGARLILEAFTTGQTPFLLFAFAVVISGWFGGLGPGLLATLVSALLVNSYFLPPLGSIVIKSPSEMAALAAFLLQGVAISALGESRRRNLIRLRAERALLEARVHDRTAELSEANIQLSRSNQELESFASVASHDLQEPLRKIRAFGDRLQTRARESLDETSLDYLGRMLRSAERMQTLIDDLLTFSRVSTRRQAPVRIDLAGVVTEVIVDLETRIETSNARVDLGNLPALVADPVQMRQLFQNLIANALKFSREGVAPVVEVRGSETPEAVVLEVQDNGIGFEPQYAERIFGVFQRLHGRGSYEGTGIGLAVCRRIVEHHGGTIEAIGRPGEGALFRITLPKDYFE
ncbi:MAG: ATP-binding protein [Vicinamibacterales bacterium]